MFSEHAIGQAPPVRLEQLAETHRREFLERPELKPQLGAEPLLPFSGALERLRPDR